MTRSYQPSFAGGVLSAGMYARSDITKYQVGLKDARNLVIRQQGGVANRPGFRQAGAPLAQRPRLIPFQFSSDQPYMLEFVGGRLRVLFQGAYILDTGHTPKAVSQLSGGNFSSTGHGLAVGDVAYLSGNNDFPGVLVEVTSAAANIFAGRVAGRVSGTTPDRTTPGLTVQKVYQGTHPFAQGDLQAVNYAQDGNDLYLVHGKYPPQRLRRVDHDDWQMTALTFVPALPAPVMTSVSLAITGFERTANGWVTLEAGHGLTAGDAVVLRADDVPATPEGEWITHINAAYRVTQVSGNDVRLQRADGRQLNLPDTSTPMNFRAVRNTVGIIIGESGVNPNPVPQSYRIAAETADGEEGPAGATITQTWDLTVQGNAAVPVWTEVPGAARYVVYKESGGAYGYIGTTSQLFFYDNNIAPDVSQGPQVPRNPFSGAGNYPRVIAFHEQRLFLAATFNDPQLVEASQSGRPLNFAVSRPPRASDALTFRPRFREVNEVRALVSGPQLILMTTGGEWLVSGGNEVALSPTNLFLRPLSYWGSDPVAPVLVGDVLMFVQRGGRVVRDFPLRGADSEARPTDLTVMASDLFRSAPIVSWAFAQSPGSVVWTVLEDGALRSLTYLAEHDIWGWMPHEIGGGGKVRQVATVLENDEHAVYAVIERNGRWATERLDVRTDDPVEGLFLDYGRTVRYAATSYEAKGLWHLAGATVSAVVDGAVYDGLTVSVDGSVELPGGAGGKVWHVGYSYDVFAQTLPIDMGAVQGIGSTQGRLKRLSDVVVLVERTRGIKAGRNRSALEELKEWGAISRFDLTPEEVGVYRITVQGDWVRAASVVVEHPYPLPFTLLGVAPEWELGG